ERPLAFRLLAKIRAAAIDRGRRSVEEGHLLGEAGVQQALRIGVVDLHHEAAVPLGRRRAGALMEDGLDLAVTLGFHARQELVLIRIVSDREVGEIVDLMAVGEVVDDQYVAHAAGVESRHDVGADHAGAARYNDHEASALSQSLENRRPYSEG